MTFQDYQAEAHRTAIYPTVLVPGKVRDTDGCGEMHPLSIVYPALGLAGEAGEFANKVKKIIRDKAGVLDVDVIEALRQELGDILWYVAECATVLDLDLVGVAVGNILKLRKRQEENKVMGSGDTR